jgi:hypothetical protein
VVNFTDILQIDAEISILPDKSVLWLDSIAIFNINFLYIMTTKLTLIITAASILAAGLLFSGSAINNAESADYIASERIFEKRTYTTYDGKLDDLHKRFEDHTMHLFEKHGMKNLGYWIPDDEELSENTLIFIIVHDNLEAAERNWDAFRNDPEWQQAYEESHADGPLVQHVNSVYMRATPYSLIQ